MNGKLLGLMKKLSKTGNFRILIALSKEPQRWSDLEKVVDKKTLSHSINELVELGLVEPTLLKDSPKGSKAYVLTDFGRFVLQKLEEIERYSKQ